MNKRFTKRVNFIANILLVFAGVSFILSLSWKYIFRGNIANAYISSDGREVVISGIDFSKSDKTLLLAVNQNCPFCWQELPFYQQLARKIQGTGNRLVAISQNPSGEIKEYLVGAEIKTTNIIQVNLNSLGISGTPTILLLDQNGELLGKWIGVLSEPTHEYILGILDKDNSYIKNDTSPFLTITNPTLPSALGKEFLQKGLPTGTTLLDISPREIFAKEHPVGALNIPQDEVYARSLNELTISDHIVIFSYNKYPIHINNAKVGLQQSGFNNISWLNLSLEECRAAGLTTINGIPH